MGYIALDWDGSEIDGRRKASGCFNLGSPMVSWISRK